MKIMVVLFRTLGDILMGTTVVHAIKNKYPDSKIDFVTDKGNVDILINNPDINQVIICDNYFDANILFVKGNYDKIFRLNMANHEDTCWHHLPQHNKQHMVEWYAKRADIQSLEDKNIYVHLSDSDNENVEKVFNELPFKDNIVCIHTSSGQHGAGQTNRVESKDWPIQFFNILAERLIRDGYNVVQIGKDGDKIIECNGVVNIFNKLTFKQLIGFQKKCKAYIGVDSGPSYLAGQSGIPTLIIMGATEGSIKGYTGPSVGPRNENVTYISTPRPENPICKPFPCFTHCQLQFQSQIHDKKHFSCLDSLNVDSVGEAFKKMMEGK